MSAWGTAIFSDDMAQDIRREYNILLSVGKSNCEIEKMLTDYYDSVLNCDNPDEEVFWFALALSEWKKGRLSPNVKEKALLALESGRDLKRWNTEENKKNYEKRRKVLEDFKNTINLPMPPEKKLRKPTVHHCPWKEGSLLAYRIVSNKNFLSNHPCYMKYVLLRIIKIAKYPISQLFTTEYYDESMIVGLYDWIGDEIPNPEIVNKIEYTPIRDYSPQKPVNPVDLSLLHSIPEESRQAISLAFNSRVEMCVDLDWVPTKDAVGDITYLGCDESYKQVVPDFFDVSICSYAMSNFLSFDITLAKKFGSYFE